MKVTVPFTVEAVLNVTVAVSVAEPPRVMVEGETVVDIVDVGQVDSAPSA